MPAPVRRVEPKVSPPFAQRDSFVRSSLESAIPYNVAAAREAITPPTNAPFDPLAKTVASFELRPPIPFAFRSF